MTRSSAGPTFATRSSGQQSSRSTRKTCAATSRSFASCWSNPAMRRHTPTAGPWSPPALKGASEVAAGLTPAEVLADLIAEGVRRRQGAVGVLVRDVPAPDPNRLLHSLASLRDEGIDLRIAYLRHGGQIAADAAGFNGDSFSTEVEQAERWRNDRDLSALIVVIAHGDEAKLSSLEDFSAISSRDLKAILVGRALGEEAGKTEVQSRWWRLLDADD